MRYRRVRKAIAGVFCGVFLAGAAVICAGILILFCAMDGTNQGGSLNLFGYTVFLSGPDAPLGEYSPGTAIVVQDVPHDSLNQGDLIVCRDLDTENQFYPVVRYVFSYDPEHPLTVTTISIGDWEILTVNRDDVIGKCVFSSSALGGFLGLIRNSEQGPALLAIILGGLAVLFAACLLWYLFLGRRAQREPSGQLPPYDPPDLFGLYELIEHEDVPLEFVEPPAASNGTDASSEQKTEKYSEIYWQ